jgi:thioredoxin-related protein
VFLFGAGQASAAPPTDVTLVMVEQPGCSYCALWNAEIAPAYPKTDAGAFAPLRRERLKDIPDDLTLDRRVVFTPTFVLVDAAGRELARIEGYPGDQFFWPVFERMLAEETAFKPPQEEDPK